MSRADEALVAAATRKLSGGAPSPPQAKEGQWDETIEGIQRGDSFATAQVAKIIGRILRGDLPEREDLIQIALWEVISALRQGRLSDPRAFPWFVRSIARNHASMSTRARRVREQKRELLDLAEVAEAAPAHEREELLDVVREMNRLDERTRRVLSSIYMHGQSYQEAACALDLPLGTLKRLQSSGLQMLRERLGIKRTGTDKTTLVLRRSAQAREGAEHRADLRHAWESERKSDASALEPAAEDSVDPKQETGRIAPTGLLGEETGSHRAPTR
jgi:RNA polymerase sigma factor (sigma-70 family)